MTKVLTYIQIIPLELTVSEHKKENEEEIPKDRELLEEEKKREEIEEKKRAFLRESLVIQHGLPFPQKPSLSYLPTPTQNNLKQDEEEKENEKSPLRKRSLASAHNGYSN